MKIARLEFSHIEYDNGLPPAVVMDAYDAQGNRLHRHAAEYKDNPDHGLARGLEFVAKILQEKFKEADGSLSFTWHK